MKTNSSFRTLLAFTFSTQLLCSTAMAACTPTPPGLVASWRAESNAVDSVAGYTGAVENVSYTPGKVGQTFVFNPSGGTTRISIPDRPEFALTNSLTIEGWIRATGAGAWTIFWRGDNRGGYDPYFIQLNPDDGNTLQFVIERESPNTAVVIETSPLAYNQWYHVAATLDGATGAMLLYTNGAIAASTNTAIRPFANLIAANDASIGIGNVGEHSFDHPFVGNIDEISLYSRALSAGEIQAIVAAGSAGKCPPVIASNNCVPPPAGAVAWWPAEGTANDVVGSNNGVLQMGAGFVPGKVGQGFRFDGTNSYVQVPDSAALKPTNVTCEAWVWLDPSLPPNRGGEQIVFKKNTWSAWFEGYSLLKVTIDNGNGTFSNRFQFCVSRSGNQVVINSKTIVQRGVWYHVAGTYDGNQSKLYVNGVLEASATPGFALDYDTTPIFIGTSGTWAPYLSMFGGVIDELAIYSRALSASEINAIYVAGSAGKCGTKPSPNPFLLNVDFQGTNLLSSDKSGPAAIGQNSDDFWNYYTRDDGFGGWRTFGFITNMFLADGTPTAIGMTIANAPGAWGNGSWDAMYNFYIYPLNGGNVTITITNLPAGIYDVLPYSGDGNIEVTVGENSYGIRHTHDSPLTNPPVWIEGIQYARFSGVRINPGQPLVLTVRPGVDGYAIISGIQIASVSDTNAVNLLANGGFEIPSDIYPYEVFDSGNPMPGWTVESGTVEITGLYWQAPEGMQSLDLNGIGEQIGTIYQDVPTFPGQKYRVRFAYAGNPDGLVPVIKSANVYWDGQILAALSFDITGHSRTNMGWTYAEYVVTATSTTTRLRFQSTSPTFCGLTLDDVSVTPMSGGGQECFDYPDFDSVIGLNLIGSTELTNGFLRLTPAVDSQTGDVWLSSKQPCANGFESSFHFRITQLGNIYGNEPGGDGFTFAVQNLSPTNQSWAMGDTNEFVAVFFNTFWNWPGCTCPDVSGNSVGILVNQTYIAQTDLNPLGIDMSDGAVHAGRVRFDGSVLNVWVDGVLVLTNVPLAGLTPGVDGAGRGWVGFTAGTGAAYENHDLLDWSFCVSSNTPSNVPIITSVNIGSAASGDVITITGENFSPLNSGNIVYFGAVRANVVTASSTELSVSVPSGATFGPITVSVNGRVAYSPKPFQPTFIGSGASLSATSFASGFNLGTGDGPARVVIADFDGDGKPDLAVANGNGHTVSLYRNISTAGTLDANSFAPRVDLPVVVTADSPYKVEAADVDGDGKLDLLAVNRSVNTISVFRNIATPGTLDASSFAPRVDFTVGALPLAVAVRDLDGDGRPEIITANYTDASVSVLKNVGVTGVINSNSFAAPVSFPVGAGAANLVCGDLDGDGRPDIAVVNFDETFLSVLRNVTGLGVINSNSFAPRVNFASPDSCEAISLGDLDGDGQLDLVSGASLRGQMMSVYRNVSVPGIINFEPRVDFASGNWVHTTALSDLNGDGKPDIALTGESASQMSVFQNLSAPGTFTNTSLAARVDFPAGWNGWGLSAGDLDGDGRPDIVFCNTYDDTLTIYRNTSPFFGAPQFSGFADQTIHYNTSTGPIAFTVSDPFYPATSLVVTASTWWPDLIDTNGIVISGTDSNRTVTLTPNSNHIGGTVIVMTVTSPGGATNQTSFVLNVVNSSPAISSIASQKIAMNSSTPALAFTVSDYETPADQLVVTATSSNTNFVPNVGLALDGTGTNRTITVTPASNQGGVTTITLRVADPFVTNQTSFTVTVDQFSQTNIAGVPSLTLGAIAWGDYDNDGWLDLIVTGTSNNLPTSAVTLLYRNNHGVLTNVLRLPGVFRSAVAWNDYDRDGWLDLSVSGLTVSNTPVTRIYHNNGNGTFTDINANLIGQYSGMLAWGDFNNDGAPDLFVSGMGGTNTALAGGRVVTNVSRLYQNNGHGGFADTGANFPALNTGSAAWGDYDNDGRLDLLLVGATNTSYGIASVYRNLGNGTFSNAYNFAQGVSYYGGSAAWGDWDNDGFLDVAINANLNATYIYRNNRNGTFTQRQSFSGTTTPASSVSWGDFANDGLLDLLVAGENVSQIYRNTNGGFASMQLSLPLALNGAAALADVDNDGDLDAFFMAKIPTLLRNVIGVSNTPPAAPYDLVSTVGLTNSVVLRWNRPVDSETKSNGLSFNIRVGTTPGGVDIVSPLADPTNGTRRIAALGNVGPTNRALLINLPKGTYYWSVQAIDSAFAGSQFYRNDVRSFTVSNALPVISDIPNIAITPGTNGPTLPFTIGDAETFAAKLLVSVRSSNTNVVPTNNIVIVRGVPSANYPSNCTVRVSARTNGVSIVTITVTDDRGAFASDSFAVTAEPFSLVPQNFVQVQNSFVAWGDYDNDGRLDVLIGGATNGLTTAPFPLNVQPVTQLYHNDGNGVFTPVVTGLPRLTRGAAAWGDYDNDGRLDLIVTGTTNNNFTGALSRIYHNNGDGTFTDINAKLPGLYNSAVAWGDYDNDGRLDFLIAGATNSSVAITRIYHNNGDGTFSNAVSLPGIAFCGVAWADFDGDGDLDLVLVGSSPNGSGAIGSVYRNNGNRSFTLAASLIAAMNSSVAVGDYDNDGGPDIAVAGLVGTVAQTRVYHNNGNFNFSIASSELPGARNSSLAWGDFDNDGWLDLAISGNTSAVSPPAVGGGFTRIYRNRGVSSGVVFTNFPVNLPTNYSGTVSWADADKDGDLDLLLTGTDGGIELFQQTVRSQTLLFRNNCNVSNTPPTAPTALTFSRSNNIINLSWAKATDAQTRTFTNSLGLITNYNGLKYQIRVGTSPGGIQIESPESDLANGFRRIVQTGDASTNRWQLANLPPGTYYWSVQAIDTAFAGSPFSAESSFFVTHPPIAVGDAFETRTNVPVTFAAAKLTLNDSDVDGDPLTVIGVSSNSTAGTVTLISGQVTYTPATDFVGNDTFTYIISDGQGGFATGNVMVTVGAGGTVGLNIVFGPTVIGGNFVVSFAGIPGLKYTIESAPSVSGPWTKVANILAPTTDQGQGVGIFTFSEPVDGDSVRFYRTVYPSY